MRPPMDTARLQTMETIARFAEEGGWVYTHPLVPVYAAEGFVHDGRIRELSEKICGGTGGTGETGGTGGTEGTGGSRASGTTGSAKASSGTGATIASRASGGTGDTGGANGAQGTPARLQVADVLNSRILANCELTPASKEILCTRIFRREGPAFFLVNTAPGEYRGVCTFHATGKALILDPATGESSAPEEEWTGPASTQIRLSMRPYQTMFVEFQGGRS